MRRDTVKMAFKRLGASSLLACVAAVAMGPSHSADSSSEVSPLIQSKSAARAGKATYLRLCQYCHGADGKALENIDFEATNLTDPTRYRYGTEPAAIFHSIKNGAGNDMLPFKDKLSDEQIWQLVSFILSIGPEERRPQQE